MRKVFSNFLLGLLYETLSILQHPSAMDYLHKFSKHMSPLGSLVSGDSTHGIHSILQHPSLLILMLAIAVVSIVLYLLILNWGVTISRDPKCECAKDWRLKYIMLFPPIALIVVMFGAYLMASYNSIIAPSTLLLVVMAGWIFLIVNSYKYINGLVVNNCNCATYNMMGDEALQIYTSLKVAWGFIIVLAIVAGAFFAARTSSAI